MISNALDMNSSIEPGPEVVRVPAMVISWIAAVGFAAVLVGSHLLPSGVDEVHRVLVVVALSLGAATRAMLFRPWRVLLTFPPALLLVAVDPLAGGLVVGLAFWSWFHRVWAGSAALAAFALLCWLRDVTSWPDVFAESVVGAVGWMFAFDDLQLGVTAVGFWPLLGGLLVLLGSSRDGLCRSAMLVTLLLVSVGYVWLRTSTLSAAADSEMAEGLFAPLWWLAAALTVLMAAGADRAAPPSRAPTTSWRTFALPLACALPFVPLVVWYLPAAPRPMHVAFLNEGGLDWHLPERATPLGVGFGMFGALPFFLEQDGMNVAAIGIEDIEAGELANADVLVTINNPRVWTVAQRHRIDEFLAVGGSLLVLGDHTDVFGCKKGFDSLLGAYGMGFRFDSAYHASSSWYGCAVSSHHPALTTGEGQLVLGHGIGASLQVEAGVESLIRGRFAFGDRGVRGNTMGAFLGNYHYEVGEIVGDLSLAAWTRVGRGRVVAYGDTSAFQGGSIPHAYRSHVLPLMGWLGRPAGIAESPSYRLLVTMLVFGVIGLVVLRRRVAPLAAVSIAAVACVAAPAWACWSAPVVACLHDKIVVDQSLGPMTGHYDVGMNQTGPLYSTLARSGLHAITGHDLERDLERRPRGIVMVAPTQRLSEHQTTRLLDYIESGGALLVAAGLESRAAVETLLATVGLDIAPVPLGVVPPESVSGPERMEPRTRGGWPLVLEPEVEDRARDLFHYGAHSLAMMLRIGSGRLVWIGDDQFFSGKNIESRGMVWPGNVRFVDQVFAQLFDGDSRQVVERFPSPEKPR